jgi:hypothetical protein
VIGTDSPVQYVPAEAVGGSGRPLPATSSHGS